MERLAADPRLDAEPAARDSGPHQRGQVRARDAVGGAGEDRERDAVFRPGCELSRIGINTIVLPRRIVSSACHQLMPAATRPDASMYVGMQCAMLTHAT